MAHIQIGDISPRIQYTITAETQAGPWTYPFPIFKDAQIEVSYGSTVKTLTTDYTVTGAGNDNGGTVTPVNQPSVGDVVTIRRKITIERTSDFQESGEFRSKVINDDLDTIIAILQEIDDKIGRAVRLSDVDTATTMTLPLAASRANKFLGFDADGDAIAAAGTSADLGPVSTFVDGLLSSVDAAAFRTGIGNGTAAVETADTVGSGNLQRIDGRWNPGTSELTIASGSVTPTKSRHTVDTESDASADDLATLATGSVSDGHVVILSVENASRVVTVKHATGNIQLSDAADRALDAIGKFVILQLLGSTWYEFPRAASSKFVKSAHTKFSAHDEGQTTTPLDNTIPQSNEGNQFMTQAFTPDDGANELVIEGIAHVAHSAGSGHFILALFKDSDTDAIAVFPQNGNSNGIMHGIPFRHKMTAGTTSAITFKVRVGHTAVGNTYFNSEGGSSRFGGTTLGSHIRVEEYEP